MAVHFYLLRRRRQLNAQLFTPIFVPSFWKKSQSAECHSYVTSVTDLWQPQVWLRQGGDKPRFSICTKLMLVSDLEKAPNLTCFMTWVINHFVKSNCTVVPP